MTFYKQLLNSQKNIIAQMELACLLNKISEFLYTNMQADLESLNFN